MLITYRGHSEFLLETANGFRILTDPYDSTVGYAMSKVECDLITVSHSHHDHNDTGKALGSPAILSEKGVYHKGGVKITGIECFHDECAGAKRGRNLIFVIETEGLRVVHLGDLGHPIDEALSARIGRTDILMLPVGGYFTIDAHQAREAARTLDARVVIPMHYKTSVNKDWPIAELSDFLDAMGEARVTPLPILRVTRGDLSEQPRLAVMEIRP